MVGTISSNSGPLDAQGLVNEAWDYYRGLGDSWIAQSRTAINDLTSVHVDPINFTVNYSMPEWMTTFVRPTRPTVPGAAQLMPNRPATPALTPVEIRALGEAPAEPDFSSIANYAPPAAPTAPMPTAPRDVIPQLDPITVPLPPEYALPELPSLYELNLPAPPAVVLPEFDGQRPTFDLALPDDGEVAFVEVPHDTTLQDALRAQILHMMQGGTGLPLAVEQAIFDRGRAREDRLSRKQMQEVAEDMSARGMSEPNGILARRLREVHADNREKSAGLNRELTVEAARIAVENMRTALAQGMALEQTLIQQNQAINDRALRLALATREIAVSRFNAVVAYQNLRSQAYATDAQVWRTKIEGALSVLETYKAQIEGQRLVGEVNKQLVERYEAGVRAVGEIGRLYKTEVEAAETRSRINTQRIEAARLKLQQFDSEVTAWGKLQDGYRTRVEAALGTTRFAETMAQVYSTRMQGYKIKGDAYFQEGRFQMERNTQTIEMFRAALQGADQDLRAQLGALSAQVDMYQADASMASAEAAALDRTTSMRIENERNRTTVALENARIKIDQALKIGEILVEQIKAKAAAIAQLAAASQSGVNFGASMSHGVSQSFSKSGSVSWSGEAPDFGGIPPNLNF